ncbi:hypothetical protein ID866_2087 [Astraeus odoratus]|nr:hypothetical protein ID866_2087 [Astraeus odoratus]
MMDSRPFRLSDHRVLIFDVYGTLIDWENGIYSFLQSYFPGEPKEELLARYENIEANLQMQYPSTMYSKILQMVFEQMTSDSSGCRITPAIEEESTSMDSGSSTSKDGLEAVQSLPSSLADVDDAVRFGASVATWEPFPDTVAALHKLKKHFALVVLSNIDDQSFEKTHVRLSSGAYGGSAYPTVTPESPFSLILTAQRIGSYKPNPLMLKAALKQLSEDRDPSLPLNPAVCLDKSYVLVVASSLRHDIIPSMQEGLRNVWISRGGASVIGSTGGSLENIGVAQEGLVAGKYPYTWRFETLGNLVDAVESELTL